MAFPDRYVTFPMYKVGAGSGVHWEVGGSVVRAPDL